MFRYKKSIPVKYDLQGYIYFVSRMFQRLPEEDKQWILNMCTQAGGEYYQAVFEFVSTDNGAEQICERHYLSRSTLERYVKKYYIQFADSL